MNTVREAWDMQCPNCGDDENLHVTITITGPALLMPGGTDFDGGDHEWDGNSPCECRSCGWTGNAGNARDACEQETVYHATVWVAATAYIKALSPDDAARKIKEMGQTDEVTLTAPYVPISDRTYDDPELPEISLSPVATVWWDKFNGVPEEA